MTLRDLELLHEQLGYPDIGLVGDNFTSYEPLFGALRMYTPVLFHMLPSHKRALLLGYKHITEGVYFFLP